jgi:hypothetical protein
MRTCQERGVYDYGITFDDDSMVLLPISHLFLVEPEQANMIC